MTSIYDKRKADGSIDFVFNTPVTRRAHFGEMHVGGGSDISSDPIGDPGEIDITKSIEILDNEKTKLGDDPGEIQFINDDIQFQGDGEGTLYVDPGELSLGIAFGPSNENMVRN